MLLKNEFEIDADLEKAWTLLTDLEQVVPCMPGAALDGRDGEKYLGNVKVKVGPISAHFTGAAYFAEKDDTAHTAVIAAEGKDPKGQAAASAKIHARLEAVSAARTRVLIDTDLDISGRMAQFGRGAIADVSNRLIGQFVSNLGSLLNAPSQPAPAAATAEAPPATTSPFTAPTATGTAPTTPASAAPAAGAAASANLWALVGPMIKERYGQAIIGGLIGFVLSWLVFGRKVGRCRNASRG
jgi:carbon monoxide dehydrogenase subunit G